MANKKSIYTASSKENILNMLDQLRKQAYSPMTNEILQDDYSDYVSDLPTDKLSEPIILELTLDSSSEEGFLTKLSKNYLDFPFAFAEGWILNNIDIPSGKMLLNTKEIDDLNFQKEFLELLQEMKDVEVSLNQARLEGDIEKVQALAPSYEALKNAYLSQFDLYREIASNSKYFDQVSKPKTTRERINNINAILSQLDEEQKELSEDLQSSRDSLRKLLGIYKISPEYKQKELENWIYQIPRAMGTSAKSMLANIGTFAATAGSRWLASLTIAGVGGAYTEAVFGAAAILTAGAEVATNIWSRDLESLAEVASNYKSNIQQYAADNNIDINEIANVGRETLRKLTGEEYSTDPNSENYRSNEEVFEDMLAYDVATNNEDLDRLTSTTKNNLNNIYNQNMALVASDIAQTALIIPGAGKLLSKTLGSLNLPERAVDGTVKILDKAIDRTLSKVASKATRKGISKYIVDPTVRIAGSSLMEGLEETTQYIIGSKINKEKEPDTGEWYNPINAFKLFAENQADLLKGVAALAGVSGDPALDNDEDLVNNFKVGAALGLLMGGSFLTVSAIKNYRSFNAGKELARNTMTDYIKAKEDIYKYTQYADKSQSKFFNKESFIDGLITLIDNGEIPEGYTKQDIDQEIDNINQIYDIVNNNKNVQSLNNEDRSIGAALIKHYKDNYEESYKSVNKVNTDLLNNINKSVEEFVKLHDIPESKINAVREYMINSIQLDAYLQYADTLLNFNETENANDESKLALKEIGEKTSYLINNLANITDNLKQDKQLSEILNLNAILSNVTDEIKEETISQFIKEREFAKSKNAYLNILNSRDELLNKINKYKQSDEFNRVLNEDLTEQLNKDLTNVNQTVQENLVTINEEDAVNQSVEVELKKTDSTKQESDKQIYDKPKTEQTTNKTDNNSITVTPEASPSVETNTQEQLQQEENATEASTENMTSNPELELLKSGNVLQLLAEQGDTSYGMDEDDSATDTTLKSEDFELPEVSQELPDNVKDIARSNESNESGDPTITSEDTDNNIKSNELATSIQLPVPETKTVTFDNDKLDRNITELDVENTAKYETDNLYDESQDRLEGLTNGTAFFQLTDQPLKNGYESGNALNEFLSVPGNLAKATVTAYVEPTNYEYGSYTVDNKATWDNAAIRIEIVGPDGKKYIASLKTIEGAERLYSSLGKTMSDSEKQDLRELRNSIIEAKINDPNCIVSFKSVSLSNGKIKRGADNRNLRNIKGLDIPKDLYKLLDSDIKFGIGKGIVSNFIIADRNGIPLPGHGGSGKIFIYPSPKNTLNGKLVPILLNEQRFINQDGTPTELAKYLANLYIFRETGVKYLYYEDLVDLLLHYGENTLIKNDDPRYEFLADKQFYFNYKEGWAQIGRERLNINDIRNSDGIRKVTEFIANNLHWNTEKNLLWQPLPSGIKKYLQLTNKTSLELPEITIKLEDVGLKKINGKVVVDQEHPNGLTTLAWLIKYGKLKTNVEDGVFTDPFLYVHDPVITSSEPMNPTRNILLEADFGESEYQSLLEQLNELKQIDLESTKDESYDPYTDANSDEVNNFFGFDIPNAKKVMSKLQIANLKKINTKKAVKWLKNKLGLDNSQIEIVDGVIRQFANGEAVYGIAHADGIAISNLAIEGVQYHEAWHRVSLLLLDSDTRNRLYEEFKKQHPNLLNINNKLLEELIADSFMDYMVNDKETRLRYYINKVFRNIKKILGFNIDLGNASLQQVFDAIKYGDFSKYKLNKSSLNEFLESYKNSVYYKVGPNNDISLKYFPTVLEFESALDSLKSCLFISNGAKYITDINKLDNTKLKKFITSYANSNKVTPELKNALLEIIDNFDVFIYHLLPKLLLMGIKSMNNEQTDEENPTPLYDKAGYEFDKKSNALASVKMFISTLSDVYFDENNNLLPKINNITGLPMVVDYDYAYATIMNNLSDVENYSPDPESNGKSLLGECARLGRRDPFFAFLYRRLCNVKDSNLETQILLTIKSQNLNFVTISYTTDDNGTGTFSIKDSSIEKATKEFPSTWSSLFFNSDLIVKTNEGVYPNKSALLKVINDYNKLFNQIRNAKIIVDSDVNSYISELVKILNNVGISVDNVTIEGLLDQTNRPDSIRGLVTSTSKGTLYHLFNGTIKSAIGGNQTYSIRGVLKVRSLDSIYMGLGVNNIIYELSQVQAITHPDDTNISVLGPNNNIVYTKTLNCYVSDLIRWLNQGDIDTLRNLNNDPYCRSSLLLNAANNKSNLRLNTFLNFYGDKTGDKGRDYLSISPTEDYIQKMVFTWNNHIIFPTMADKKTWFTISGVLLFNKKMDITQIGNKLKFEFNVDALNYLYQAWEDEYNSIVNYYNNLSSVKVPIKNYHTSNKGGLFRHFTGYYVNNNGKNEWFDLNEEITNAIEYDKKNNTNTLKQVLDGIRNDLFTDVVSTMSKINNNLIVELLTELDTCEKLGIIERTDSRNYKNKLLNKNIFEYFKELYLASSIPTVRQYADKYAIMAMVGNHMINLNVSVIETEKIITGDLAFYKNDDDKIKRLGAVLSTGDNLRTQWLTNDPDKLELYKELNANDFYTCAIFNDNEIPSSQYNTIKELFRYDQLRNLLIEKQGLSEAEVDDIMKNESDIKLKYPEIYSLAETLSLEDAEAYGLNSKKTKGNINQADAAVYIRPAMYQSIVRRLGEWSPEVEEAFKILESDEDWLSNKELYAKSLKTLIKALKTTYFGYTYNSDLGCNVPVFNKMAMFPMFKAIATGDNREIYDRMNAIGKYSNLLPIDLIAFESAVKVGIQGGHNFYSDYTNNNINDLSKINTTTQYFRNLRRQLITDPHTHDRTLFGTQVSTVAVSNLVMDRVYGDENNQRTGLQLKEQLFGTINAISEKGIQQVANSYMTNGEIDLQKTSNELIRKAHSSNMGKNIEDALLYNKDLNDFEVSLSALPDSKWAETALISDVNKKAIDLELPGGAFILMSSFGFKSIKAVGTNAIAGGKRLVNINEDGSMDAIISINLFRHVIPDFDNLSFTEAKKWLMNAGIIYDPENPNRAKPMAIGYRIPTQGLSSIAGIRIKDVLPSNVGDMIILPDEFTTQTGSDFD